MELVSNFGGYRLTMATNQEFQQAQSLQVYKGIIAKIMIFFNLAFCQEFLDKEGNKVTVAINFKSLGHYIWRHNISRDDKQQQYTESMSNLYKISHQFFHKKHKSHKSYTKEMCYQIAQRALFKGQPLTVEDFQNLVQKQAPLKGIFYKVKKDDKTVGYVLGTIHVGNELLLNLNPKINKALDKSQVVAGEKSIDKLNQHNFKLKEGLEQNYLNFAKAFNSMLKQSRLESTLSIEKCILKKVQAMQDKPKLEALETDDELNESTNLLIELYDKQEKGNSNEIYQIFQNVLSGDEKFVEAQLDSFKDNKIGANIIQRNSKIVDRAEHYFQKNRTFIAVGYLHLIGEHGIKHLFEKKKGYTLARV